jgi:hypothetical protein
MTSALAACKGPPVACCKMSFRLSCWTMVLLVACKGARHVPDSASVLTSTAGSTCADIQMLMQYRVPPAVVADIALPNKDTLNILSCLMSLEASGMVLEYFECRLASAADACSNIAPEKF